MEISDERKETYKIMQSFIKTMIYPHSGKNQPIASMNKS